MILYDLLCDQEHQFESWFKNSGAYDALSKANKVLCPVCGSAKVNKAPMAPNLSKSIKKSLLSSETNTRSKNSANIEQPPGGNSLTDSEALKNIRELQTKIEENFENVGAEFPEEARKIHYGETEARGIYGEASIEDAKELVEEGVEIATIPWHKRRTS